MITTNLKGGLGNQMFQYATGRFLAYKNRSELKLFKEPASKLDTYRNYELGKFNIQENFVPNFKKNLPDKIFRRHYPDYHPALLTKASAKLSKGKNVYLNGFFQSEKNFLEIRDVLLKEFTLKEEFKSDSFKKLSEHISSQSNSVSIHIRRGDYVKNSQTNKYHGTCSLSYYEKAIENISEQIENSSPENQQPIFYIFTDDVAWAKENLILSEEHQFISGHGLSFQEEMILMSKCKHNIIANSSFSWWGAWLNQNDDKIVIAPTPWVNKKPNPHPNITPESWTLIPKN
jgi:hypothetical protein